MVGRKSDEYIKLIIHVSIRSHAAEATASSAVWFCNRMDFVRMHHIFIFNRRLAGNLDKPEIECAFTCFH